VREDRPVPLCWRTPFQRQQSGKRHILDQHFRHYLCHNKFSGIIHFSSSAFHYSSSPNDSSFKQSLPINKSEKSCLSVRFISYERWKILLLLHHSLWLGLKVYNVKVCCSPIWFIGLQSQFLWQGLVNSLFDLHSGRPGLFYSFIYCSKVSVLHAIPRLLYPRFILKLNLYFENFVSITSIKGIFFHLKILVIYVEWQLKKSKSISIGYLSVGTVTCQILTVPTLRYPIHRREIILCYIWRKNNVNTKFFISVIASVTWFWHRGVWNELLLANDLRMIFVNT